LKNRRTNAAANIPTRFLNGAIKQALVISELLQRSHVAARANDRDQITWLQLHINELA